MKPKNGEPIRKLKSQDRIKVTLYLSQHKDEFNGLIYHKAAARIQKDLGLYVTAEACKEFYTVIGIQLPVTRGGGKATAKKTKLPKTISNRLRMLAIHVRYLYRQLAVDIPPTLQMLATGRKISKQEIEEFLAPLDNGGSGVPSSGVSNPVAPNPT